MSGIQRMETSTVEFWPHLWVGCPRILLRSETEAKLSETF